MKIDLSCQAKSNHTVTVPRDYIEQLEEFYKTHMENHFNMRGDVKFIASGTSTPISYVSERKRILFITDNELEMLDAVIIVDDEGREKSKFIRNLR